MAVVATHYDVLGIKDTASFDDVKRAYYRKARSFHPDVHSGSTTAVLEEAQRAMAAVNAAWNVLRDPRLRAEYDEALAAAAASVRVARGRRRRDHTTEAPALELGSGFRFWMGSCGIVRTGSRRRFNIAINGATSLAPLRTLAPDRLFALHAAGSAVHDAELVNLQGMTELRQLDLARTALTDAGLLHLQGLDSLEVLDVWDTGITDAGLAIIGRLPSLRHLGLGGTAITDAGLASIAGLAKLRVLQLWGTRVSGRGLEHLHGLLDLEIVTLPWSVGRRCRRRLTAALPRASIC